MWDSCASRRVVINCRELLAAHLQHICFAAMSMTRGSWDRATGALSSNATATSPTRTHLPTLASMCVISLLAFQ
jgi:hypothetical protein